MITYIYHICNFCIFCEGNKNEVFQSRVCVTEGITLDVLSGEVMFGEWPQINGVSGAMEDLEGKPSVKRGTQVQQH